jgi:hypothetical protein
MDRSNVAEAADSEPWSESVAEQIGLSPVVMENFHPYATRTAAAGRSGRPSIPRAAAGVAGSIPSSRTMRTVRATSSSFVARRPRL